MRAGTFFHQEDQFKDPELDIEQIGRYRLCYYLMQDGLAIAAFDNRTKTCLLFERYRATTSMATRSSTELATLLQELISGHHLLSAGYWRDIVWMATHTRFTLVPQALFRSDEAAHYLRLNSGKPLPAGQAHSFTCLADEYVCLFEEHKVLVDCLRAQYKNSRLILGHSVGAFLEGVFQQQEAQLHELNLFMHGEYITLLNINAKNLRFLNIFPVKTPEDVLYFTLSVAETLEIPFSELKVRLFGRISHESPSQELLQRYAKSVTFGHRPASLRFSGSFNAFAHFGTHRFFSLFSACLLTP